MLSRVAFNRSAGKVFGGSSLPPGFAAAVLKGYSIAEIRSMGAMPDEAQRLIDEAVVRVGVERLSIVADMRAQGLTFSIPDPLSVMELYWEAQSKAGGAQRTMRPGARGERQQIQRSGRRIPIYATTDDFSMDVRILRVSERAGAPLDTSNVEECVRRVNEAIEDAAIFGWTDSGGSNLVTVGGFSAPGLLNVTGAQTYTYTGSEAWDVVGHTGEEILTDVLGMKLKLIQKQFYGPYWLWVNTTYNNKLDEDFKANSDLTIRQRLLQIDGLLGISVADRLPADRTVMMQMTSDVADIAVGQEPVPISWTDGPGFELSNLILSFIVPRFKTNYDGYTGICLGNKS